MFGYFKYKVRFVRKDGTVRYDESKIQHDWLKAVCFTETPIDHVYLQTKKIYGRQMQFEPYGLAFREDVVLRRNGNPLFYFYSSNSLIKSSLDQLCYDPSCVKYKNVMPYFQEFGPPLFSRENAVDIDFRWEREWRISGDFSFSLSDVAFGLCPKEDKETFKRMVNNQFPFIDLNDDVNLIKGELKKWLHLQNIK
jgi:hypothetical protein